MRALIRIAVAGIGGVACADLSENPCQDYVDYVCECHADNPDLDCETVREVHINAGVDLYEDCRVEHEALIQADEDLGTGCASEGETGESDLPE